MHDIRYSSYDIKTSKKLIQAECDEVAIHEDWQEGCSGLPRSIEFSERVFDDYEEAYNYLEKKGDAIDYYSGAVQYLSYPNLSKTKHYLDLETRINDWSKKLTTLDNNIHYANVKASFVSCPNCNSKINREFIRWNNCPICRADMRPKTTLDTIARYREIIKDLKKELDIETKKMQAKAKNKAVKKWLVRFEFHC